MRRWNIKERFIPQLNSYRIFAPKDPLVIHDIFDLVTKVVLYDKEGGTSFWNPDLYRHMRRTAGHGLAVLGLGHIEMSTIWANPDVDRKTYVTILSASEDRATARLLEVLWRYRHQLALLPETWRSVLEGHPVLGPLGRNCPFEEIAPIADGIIGTARKGYETIKNIDSLILKAWGVTESLPQKTMQDLANRYPEVLELNEWYSYEDFGLSSKS